MRCCWPGDEEGVVEDETLGRFLIPYLQDTFWGPRVS